MMLRRALAAVGSSARMLVLAGGVTALGLGCSQAPSPASVRFTDVTEAAGVTYLQQNLREEGSCLLDGGFDGPGRGTFCDPERMSGGAAAGDYDNDGFVDLYVTRLDAPDILFRNKGDGTFEDVTAAAGLGAFLLKSNGAVWADIDNDGHQDLYVTTIADTRFYLFMNDGLGGFTEEAISRNAAVETGELHVGFSVAIGDYDRDGWLDIHTNEWGAPLITKGAAPSHSRLLRNLGETAPGHFEDVTAAAGVLLDDVRSQTDSGMNGSYAFASAFNDLDADGWPDLVVVSDFGNTRLFWNNGDGTFQDGTIEAGVGSDKHGMGSAFGDYDGDGDQDWFVTSTYQINRKCATEHACLPRERSGNRLYKNEGGRLFSDATDAVGVRDGGWGWGSVFLDFDNDGDLDLVMVSGMHNAKVPTETVYDPTSLWVNDGSGRMKERSTMLGITDTEFGKGVLTFDYDNDGDLDIFIANTGGPPILYRNDGGNALAWLRVRLIGETTNRNGVGARIALKTTPEGPVQIREIGVRSHFLGQSELTEHFGLGEGPQTVAEVIIEWPCSGEVTVLRNVPANSTIVVHEGREGYEIEAH